MITTLNAEHAEIAEKNARKAKSQGHPKKLTGHFCELCGFCVDRERGYSTTREEPHERS
jgi:hypothetical protein